MGNKALTRERILEAAEVVFANKGYHEAIMDEIVQHSETSKGTVYFHFPSKERLFFAVIDSLAERLVRRVEKQMAQESDPLKKVEIALSTVMESLSKRRNLAKLLLVQGYSMGNAFEKKRVEIFSRFAALIKRNLDQAVEAGLARPTDTTIVAQAWLGAISEVIIRWLYTGKPTSIQEALFVLKTLLLQGIAAEGREKGDLQRVPSLEGGSP